MAILPLAPLYVKGGSLVFLRDRAEPAQPRPQCRFGAGQLLPCGTPRSPEGSTLPAALLGAMLAPNPASSRWGGWRWGSLRQRQTKAQRRALPSPPGLLGSATPGSPAHLPARPAGRRAAGCGESGAGGSAGRSRTKRRGWRNVCVCASQTGSRTTSLTSCCFPDVTSEA